MVLTDITGYVKQRYLSRSFAARHSGGTKLPCWIAKVALGQDKQKPYIILNGNFLCLSYPSATFAIQDCSFVPCEWLAAKGLFTCYLTDRIKLMFKNGLRESFHFACKCSNSPVAGQNESLKIPPSLEVSYC